MNTPQLQPATNSRAITVSDSAWEKLTGLALIFRCSRTEIICDLIAQRYAEVTGKETP